ncbi:MULTISPECIES: winged helix-turn-helix transcriptional regulator [Actinoalloteichus]|uniref:Transcriptional regulator, HxlR family n=1 Tax=Actinoalloteichus fjordicus TaxID=1612552 RepID=A0AAC9PSM1_9PSEU|nr:MULTISPECIES: helix-turn-helix domain-containing protein [Actinoalloteichus]APU15278.1 transcriptional regulator, HxlR family [Actinoalloteichus fjordicus]APU21323.1 transcriptional regulator, HxlR family [Actinoalloteichus sp. GBA129-24]
MNEADELFLSRWYAVRSLLGDKWVPAVLMAVSAGPLRRVEILSTIRSYSLSVEWSNRLDVLHDSILTKVLKKLTDEGLLTRSQKSEVFPPHVSYGLTPAARDFVSAMSAVVDWAGRHEQVIVRARAVRDGVADVDWHGEAESQR